MAKTQKSSLFGKLGSKLSKAVETHKGDETEYGQGGNLPAGIEGGIAQLTECKFDVYKKGDMKDEYYFYASGVVKQPKEHNGIPIEGLQTRIMEPMCDTPKRSRKTVDEHVAWVLNEMRKLGYDTEGLGGEDLEQAAKELKEAAPHFRFRTWKGQPATSGPYKGKEPLTNEQWGKAVEYSEDASDAVVDETEEDEEEEDKEEEETEEEDEEEQEEESEEEEETEEEEAEESEEEEEEAEEVDYAALGKKADKDDEKAQAKLSELAEEAGLDPEEYDSWKELAEKLASPDEEESEEESEEEAEEEAEEEEEEESVPEKEQAYQYKPPKAKKAVECEVMSVQTKAKTVSLKNLADGKTLYKGVSWDKLISE